MRQKVRKRERERERERVGNVCLVSEVCQGKSIILRK